MPFNIKDAILHSQTDEEISFEISTTIYPLEAIYQAAHVFTRDSYVVLDGNPKKSMQITLCYKNPKLMKDQNLLGDFMNELLSQTIRVAVNQKTRKQKEAILSHALSVNLN